LRNARNAVNAALLIAALGFPVAGWHVNGLDFQTSATGTTVTIACGECDCCGGMAPSQKWQCSVVCSTVAVVVPGTLSPHEINDLIWPESRLRGCAGTPCEPEPFPPRTSRPS